ncbi:DUF711 family protein [Sulfurisphaera javensis]|uniref:DUF711 family protein n=1 Tax=Sulfurisphaera javensis TaxID=2049879 RepID=A0AAT9GU43_9CREN
MKIRALAIFVTNFDKSRIDYYVQRLNEIKDEKIWTKRIALPPTPKDLPLDKITELLPNSRDVIFSAIHLRSNDKRVKDISNILQTSKSLYASILLSKVEDSKEIANFIYSLEPEIATRIAVLIYDDFLLTPYFPVGSANTIADSLAISVLYAKDYLEGKINKSIAEANEFGIKYSKQLQLRYLGIDISLSPWMNESVAEIIENKSGKLFSHGNTYAVFQINREIFNIAWQLKVTPIGFSETMLPIAEDLILMKRVEEGSLKLPNLQQLTFACVAGLDMVPIPRDKDLYYNILLDSIAIQFNKRRPYGIRIIPTTGSGYIFINDYGKIPEIKTI